MQQASETSRFELPSRKEDETSGVTVELRPATIRERMAMYDAECSVGVDDEGNPVVPSRTYVNALNFAINHIVTVTGLEAPTQWPADGSRLEREQWLNANVNDFDILAIGVEVRRRAFLGGREKN